MILETVGIFIIAFVANMQDFLGTSFIGRPLVTSLFVGLLFGDVTTGLIIGATLELVFLGLMGIGATVPPDEIIGGILAVALVMKNGYGVEVALSLVLPIAALGLAVKNILYVFVFPVMTHRADNLAAQGKIDQSANMHLIASFTRILLMSLVTTLAYYFGHNLVETFLNLIPQVIIDGLSIMSYLLPAVGFAMLLNMIFSAKVAPFLFVGFVAATYLGLDMVAISIIGLILAAVMYIIFNEMNKLKLNINSEGEEFDDF